MNKLFRQSGLLAATLGVVLVASSSCEELDGFLNTNENAEGLKTALEVGTDTAVSFLSAPNGYFEGAIAGAALRILLPEQVQQPLNEIKNSQLLGSLYSSTLEPLEDDLILSINRAAEDAAPAAKDIFFTAIRNMTITDALNIVNGADNAATEYLKANTMTELTVAFATPIDESLDKPLVLNTSSNTLYTEFISTYNSVVNNSLNVNPITGNYLVGEPINTAPTLGAFATEKALDGLFVVVEKEEADIRADPFAYALDILERVFGGAPQ